MDITVHETLKSQLSRQDALKMLGGLSSGELFVTGRDFTLYRQFCTARKLTKSHGIMPKVEICFKILGHLCYDKNWFKKSWNTSVTIFVCLFVCLVFLLSNQRNNKIFPKQTSFQTSFFSIHLFLFIQADKTVWNNNCFSEIIIELI